MTDTQHRQHSPDPDRVSVRDIETDADDTGDRGLMAIRMPLTSTAEARDGMAFDRDRVEGFADQLRDTRVPVFLDHGRNDQTGHRYSALGKVGYLADPEVVDRDAATDLVADFRLVDPDDLDDDVGAMREMLAWLRTQAERGLPIASSIGWSEDTGERDLPGDADLLEASIVGIPSDARTTTAGAPTETALARAVGAASDGFDTAQFLTELRAARDDGTRNVVDVGGEEVDLTPPDAVQNAATVGLAKDDALEPDCGTGAGRESARQIADDSISADRIDDIAAYLTSHEADVTAEGPPSDWSDEEWADCGNLQYALWGGTGTGTGLEWAQDRANAVAEAAGDELPYPERALASTMAREAQPRNLDDPEFGAGDAVMWSSNDTSVHGRVAEVGAEFEPADGVVITGDEGEAVYLIHELDDSLEPPQYRRENVAKPESSLDESTMDLPPTDGNFADDTENSMTTSDTDDSGEQPDDESRDDSDGMDAAEYRETMLELQQSQTDILREMREGGMDDDDDMDGDDDEDDEEENAADAEDADDGDAGDRAVNVDADADRETVVADLRAALEDTDHDDLDVQTTDRAADDADAADDSTDDDTDDAGGYGMAARME